MGFGGHGGVTGAYVNHPVALEGYTIPNNMKALGVHMRVPFGSWETSLQGTLEWRTVNTTDGAGVVDVAIDQIALAATVRRVVPISSLRLFAGIGPAVMRLRRHFQPEGSRGGPISEIHAAGEAEFGLAWLTPWPRLEVGTGVRYRATLDNDIRSTLFWIGLTVWSREH